MLIFGTNGAIRRILAATVALALMATATVGAFAHARHHGSEHGAAQHIGEATGLSEFQDFAAVDGGVSDLPGLPEERLRGVCLDSVCHGGFALLAGTNISMFTPVMAVLTLQANDELGHGRQPGPLDRPPLPIRS